MIPITYIESDTDGTVQPDYNNLFGGDPTTSFYWTMTYPNQTALVEGGEFDINFGMGEDNGMYGPAPMLMPINSTPHTDISTGDELRPNTLVNVRDLHHWTESPISARREVPMLNLKEQKIINNVNLNNMLQMVYAALGSAKGAYDFWANGEVGEKVGFIKDLLQSSNDPDAQKEKLNQLKNQIENEQAAPDVKSYSDPMNPYKNKYTTQATGFKYVLPYMENKWVNQSSSFAGGGGEGGNIMGMITDASRTLKAAADVAGMVKVLAPGRLIEEPKAFNFSGREKSYTVSFPLFNTKSYAEVVRNWQFLHLLSYQNTPNRINADLIDPPCIYEAYIPGVWYSKYSAITEMTVDYVGARREMYLPIQVLDKPSDAGSDAGPEQDITWLLHRKKTVAVVPDAYQVTITITELFPDSQNFKYQMLRESMNDIISTGVM
jgi:hypothetical protein